MDFKYTKAGSDEQLSALKTLNSLISMWATYIINDEWELNETVPLILSVHSSSC